MMDLKDKKKNNNILCIDIRDGCTSNECNPKIMGRHVKKNIVVYICLILNIYITKPSSYSYIKESL